MVVNSRPVPEYLPRIGASAVRHEHRVAIPESMIDNALAVRRPSQVGGLLAKEITRRTSGQGQQPQPQPHITTADPNFRAVGRKTDVS